jgi:hypothetical protein
MAASLLVRGGRVVPMTGPGVSFAGDVLLEGGRIAAVGSNLSGPPAPRCSTPRMPWSCPGSSGARPCRPRPGARPGRRARAAGVAARADLPVRRHSLVPASPRQPPRHLDADRRHHRGARRVHATRTRCSRPERHRFASGKCHLDTGEPFQTRCSRRQRRRSRRGRSREALARRGRRKAAPRWRHASRCRALSCSVPPPVGFGWLHAREREPRGTRRVRELFGSSVAPVRGRQ